MPNERTELEPKGKPVITRILVPLDWTLWGILLVVLLYALGQVATERTSSPEAGRGLGMFAVVFLLAVLVGAAFGINAAARKQSVAGLIAMTLLLAWPAVFLIADPAVRAFKERRFAREEARVGDFSDPAIAPLARAIAQHDSAALLRLLGRQAPVAAKDRAGNDLLAFALVTVREKKGSASLVRALLEAGADPRKTRMGSGEDVVTYMLYGRTPKAREAIRLLLEHGADPNVVDAKTGNTPLGNVYDDPEVVRLLVEHGADIDHPRYNGATVLVNAISSQQWETALYLIEKGANLDIANPDGLSVDYYLKDWQESVYGEHPDGWDRVREAIAARRGAHR